MIIARYLSREVMRTTLSITLLLMLIFSCHQLVRFFGAPSEGQFPLMVALKLVLVQWPILLGYFLPLFLYLSIVVTYSRLYHSSEMVAMFTSGLSRWDLVMMTLKFSLVLFLFECFFVFEAKPWLGHEFEQLRAEAVTEAPLQLLSAGKFKSINNGQVVYYAESTSRHRDRLNNLFIASKSKQHDSRWDVMFARQGSQKIVKGERAPYLVLTDGHQYMGRPGHADYDITAFETLAKRIDGAHTSLNTNAKFASTHQLWLHRDIPVYAAEWHWRMAGVVSIILLVLLAIPLSHVRPRQGSFAKLFPAIILYGLYVNCLLATRSWIKQDTVNLHWSMWEVHLAMMIVIAIMYFLDDRDRYLHIIRRRME